MCWRKKLSVCDSIELFFLQTIFIHLLFIVGMRVQRHSIFPLISSNFLPLYQRYIASSDINTIYYVNSLSHSTHRNVLQWKSAGGFSEDLIREQHPMMWQKCITWKRFSICYLLTRFSYRNRIYFNIIQIDFWWLHAVLYRLIIPLWFVKIYLTFFGRMRGQKYACRVSFIYFLFFFLLTWSNTI